MENKVQEEIDIHKCMICHTVISGLERFISHGRTCTWKNYNGTFTFENLPKLRPLGMPSPAVSYRSSPTPSFSSSNGSDFDQINEDIGHYYASLLSDEVEDCSTENDKMETSARSINVGDEGDDDESRAMEEKERIWKQSLQYHEYAVSYERSNALQLALKEACEGMKIDCPNLLNEVCYEENSRECVESKKDVLRKAVSKTVNGSAFGKDGLAGKRQCSSNTDGTMGDLLLSNPLGDLGYVEIIGDDEKKVPLVKTNSTLNIGHLSVDPEVATCMEAEINIGRGRGMKRGRGRTKRGRGRWRGGRGRGSRLDIQEKRFVDVGSSEYSENGAEAMRGVETKVRGGRGRGRGRGPYRGRGYHLSKALKNVENVIEYVNSNECKEVGYKACSDVREKQVDSVFTALATSSSGRIIRKPVKFLSSVQKHTLPEKEKVCQTIPTDLDDMNEYEATTSVKRRRPSCSGLNEGSCKTTPGAVLETEQFHSKKVKRMRNVVAEKPVCDIDSNSGEVPEQVLVASKRGRKPKSVNVKNKSVKNSSFCSKHSAKADTTPVSVEGTLDEIDCRDEVSSSFTPVNSSQCSVNGENQPTQSPTKSVSTENKFVRNSSSCSKQTIEADSGESQPTLEEICSGPSNLISDDLTFAPKERCDRRGGQMEDSSDGACLMMEMSQKKSTLMESLGLGKKDVALQKPVNNPFNSSESVNSICKRTSECQETVVMYGGVNKLQPEDCERVPLTEDARVSSGAVLTCPLLEEGRSVALSEFASSCKDVPTLQKYRKCASQVNFGGVMVSSKQPVVDINKKIEDKRQKICSGMVFRKKNGGRNKRWVLSKTIEKLSAPDDKELNCNSKMVLIEKNVPSLEEKSTDIGNDEGSHCSFSPVSKESNSLESNQNIENIVKVAISDDVKTVKRRTSQRRKSECTISLESDRNIENILKVDISDDVKTVKRRTSQRRKSECTISLESDRNIENILNVTISDDVKTVKKRNVHRRKSECTNSLEGDGKAENIKDANADDVKTIKKRNVRRRKSECTVNNRNINLNEALAVEIISEDVDKKVENISLNEDLDGNKNHQSARKLLLTECTVNNRNINLNEALAVEIISEDVDKKVENISLNEDLDGNKNHQSARKLLLTECTVNNRNINLNEALAVEIISEDVDKKVENISLNEDLDGNKNHQSARKLLLTECTVNNRNINLNEALAVEIISEDVDKKVENISLNEDLDGNKNHAESIEKATVIPKNVFPNKSCAFLETDFSSEDVILNNETCSSSSITELNVCNMDAYTGRNSPTRDLADTVVTDSVVAGMSKPTNESLAFDEDSTSQFVIENIRTIASNTWEETSLEGDDSSCIIIEDSCNTQGIRANSIDEGTKTVSNQISDQENPTRLSTRSKVNLGFRCDSKEYQQKQNAKLSTACRNSSSSLERINEPPLKDNVSIPTSIDVEPESIENNKLKFQGIFSVDIVKNLQYLKPLFSKLGNNIDFAPSNSGGLVPSVVVLPENRKEKEKSLMIRVDYKKIDSNPMCECICGRKKEFVQQLDLQRQCVLKECQDPSAVDHTWECYLNPNHPNECICDSNKSIPKANSNSDSRSVSECSSTTSLGTAMESCEYNFSGKLIQAIQDNNFIRQPVSNEQCSSSTVSKIGDLNLSKKALDDASSCSSVTDLRKDCWMPSIEMTDLSNIDECAENPKINGSKTIYDDPPILRRRSLRRSKSIDRLTYLREWPIKKTNKSGHEKLIKRRSNCDDGYISEYTPCDIDSETEDPTYLSQRSRKTKRKYYRKKTSTKKLSTHNDGYVTDYNSCNEDTMDECDFLLERATSISRCELFEKENGKGDDMSDKILRVKKNKFSVYREMPLRICKSTANYCPGKFY